MSRAYRVAMATAVTRASDAAELDLALLPILGAEEMRELLREELANAGWTAPKDNRKILRRAFGRAHATLSGDGRKVVLAITGEIRTRVAQGQEERVATALTPQLERQLVKDLGAQEGELRAELDAAIQRTYAAALRRKAASIGEIESVSETKGEDGCDELVIKVRV